MSQQNKTAFQASIDALLADNTSELITELVMRTMMGNIKDSVPFLNTLNSYTAQQRWAKGADVASATALDIGTDGNYFDVTGTTTITSITDMGGAGTVVILQFDGALTFTHHATDLILPGGANITTAAGDHAIMVNYASGDWRCVGYFKASGEATVLQDISGKQDILSEGAFVDGDKTKLDGLSSGGDVSKVGTPANNQVGVWTGDGTIEGDADLTFDGTTFSVRGSSDPKVTITDSIITARQEAGHNAIVRSSGSSNPHSGLGTPKVQGAYTLGVDREALQIHASGLDTSGSIPVMTIISENVGSALTTRPVLAIFNYTTKLLEIAADGTVDFQGNTIENFAGVVADTATVYDTQDFSVGAMIPSITNGAEAGTRELATNDVMIDYLAFDKDTDEYAQWNWVLPEQVTSDPAIRFKFKWTAAAGSGTVLWGIQHRVSSNDDAIDGSWGTASTATADTLLATDDDHLTDGACTVTLTGYTAGDTVWFRVFRDVSGDTLSDDAQLLRVVVQYPRNNTASTVWS